MNNFGNGAPLLTGFDLNAPLPLDHRSVVDTLEELLNLSENNLVCHGQTTFVEETQLFYQYTGNGETGGWEEVCSLEKLKDVIKITKEEITVNMENLEEGLRNKITTTAKELESKFSDLSGGDFSSIIQDINSIRLEVSTLEGRLNSKITQTADTIMLELTNREDGLKSQITATAKELRSEFTEITGGDFSAIYQDLEGLHAEITAMNGTLNNKIDVTAQGLKADMNELESGLRSEIELSAKNLESKFSEIAGGDFSSIYQDMDTIRTEISAMDGELTSKIEQTATTLRTEMSDMEAELESKIELSAENLESKFSEIAGGDYSSIYQDIENIRTEIADVDSKLTSSISQTASSIRTEVTDFKNQTESKFTQLSDSIETSVGDLNGKYTALQQTVDDFKIQAGDGEALNAKIEATATQIRSEVSAVNDRVSQVSQTADKINWLVKSGTSSSNMQMTDEAISLIASKIQIESEEIKLEGYTTINGGFAIDLEGNMTAKNANVSGTINATSGSFTGTISGSTITGSTITTGSNFKVDNSGKLTASNAIISGEITATSGSFKGNITSGSTITGAVISNGNITGAAINNGNGTFSVDANGNLTAKSASISGDITGSTFSSNNDEFMVLEDGTVKSQSLVIEDLIRTQTLNVDEINNPCYPQCMYEATKVYIDEYATDEQASKIWQDGGVYQSIDHMLSYAPRNLGGYTLTINLQSNINSNISLSWFHSGQVNIEFNGHTVYGYVYCYGASMVYRLYGQFNGQSSDADPGFVMPYKGKVSGSYTYGLYFQYCQFAVNNISVYPDKVNDTMSGGLYADRGARGCVFKINAMGNMRYLVRADYGSHVYVSKSTGRCNNATFCASTGGIICINSNETQAGTTSSKPYWAGAGGSILTNQVLGMDLVTFDNASNGGTNNNPGTNTGETVTVTETVKAISADTYRSTVYNNWKGDGTCRQGDYGYGDCQGCWFFGNSLYNTMNAGTVTKVVIRIKRQSGGVNSLQTMTVKSHNHTSRPSGAPTYTDTIGTCSCAVGSYIDLIIKDTATINKLKACKGIGLSIGSTSSPYIVCSGNCQVIITYKTTVSD